MGNFDKRTIELFLARAEKSQPPKHLADLGIAGLMETSGRERRHRYYTVAAYQKLVATEQLDKTSAGFTDIDVSDTGGFSVLHPSLFYTETSELEKFEDTFNRVNRPSKRQFKNPILPDGTVKQGRPRKKPLQDVEAVKKASKRKLEAMEVNESESPTKKRKGDMTGEEASLNGMVSHEYSFVISHDAWQYLRSEDDQEKSSLNRLPWTEKANRLQSFSLQRNEDALLSERRKRNQTTMNLINPRKKLDRVTEAVSRASKRQT